MDILKSLLIIAAIVGLCLGSLYWWARYQEQKYVSSFEQYAQELGFSVLPYVEQEALQLRLKALPDWQNERINIQAVAARRLDDVQVFVIVCEQIGESISAQFVVLLFSSPALQLPSFHLRPKRQNGRLESLPRLPKFSQEFRVGCIDREQVTAHFRGEVAQHYLNWLAEKGWTNRLRVAGVNADFINYYLTTSWPNKDELCTMLQEGWQHMLVHKLDGMTNPHVFIC